jgi:hypothetical protein
VKWLKKWWTKARQNHDDRTSRDILGSVLRLIAAIVAFILWLIRQFWN